MLKQEKEEGTRGRWGSGSQRVDEDEESFFEGEKMKIENNKGK